MDFRVLPPQRRLDIGRCHAGPYTRFGKQRSDRFTISYRVVAIARRGFLTSFIDGLVSSRLDGSRGFVRDIAGEHSPSDASILVGEGHGRDVRMPALPKARKPAASRILLASGFAKSSGDRRLRFRPLEGGGYQIAMASSVVDCGDGSTRFRPNAFAR